MWNKVFNRLPDNYSREGQVNNVKLHKIVYEELEEIKKAFEDIKFNHDIDNATGKTLDLIGGNVLQYRGIGEDDELYRLMIKTKVIANLSQGDIETINEVATVLLGENYVGVRETWGMYEYDNEPAGLVIELRPKSKHLPLESIDRVIAGGVGLHLTANLDSSGLQLQTKYKEYPIPYNMCGTFLCGTKPYIQNEGISFNTQLNTNTGKNVSSKQYLMAGTFKAGGGKA